MTDLVFPDGFLWGTATAAHQVEGDNANSDWWGWERRPGGPCREPSGSACDHYHRYPADIGLLAELGFGMYRFSVEWARIEPEPGAFDAGQLQHYRAMVDEVAARGMRPMVTLNHFTLPRWVAARGGWLDPAVPSLFARYCGQVVEALGDGVEWYCTINEPGVVAYGGYLGALPFPPGRHDLRSWRGAIRGLVEGHRRAREAVKERRPSARVGLTNAMQEWAPNRGARPLMSWLRAMNEDVFLLAARDDDFVGVQTYTRQPLLVPSLLEAPIRRALRTRGGRRVAAGIVRRVSRSWPSSRPTRGDGVRLTQMGYEYRPEAVAATIRRAAELLPGKEIIVTEHGVATADDAERVEFIVRGLTAVHEEIERGRPVRGYIHWSAFDNFEWALGYDMTFGLIGVDRATQERSVKPSARFLGEVARTNRLTTSRVEGVEEAGPPQGR